LNIKLYEKVVGFEESGDSYTVATLKGNYQSKAIVVSTGFYDLPNTINVPGENLPKVSHYYKEPHPYWGQKIVVIGAANSAVDVALECFRKGAHVTMVIKQPVLGDNIKYWAKPDIENRIKESSIKAYFNSSVTEIKEKEVIIQTPEGIVAIENDFVLAMTGYLPDFSLLQLLEIELGNDVMKTPVYDPETMETNMKNIYLAGVICGGLKTNKWFIENSREHAVVVMKDLSKKLKA
jgi:thioredoxin reductase (NADPH)